MRHHEIAGKDEVTDRLVEGLRRMEYRGRDSAGVCVVENGALIRGRAEGKLSNLVAELSANAPGHIGIAHNRRATLGAPTTNNADPHATEGNALVHDGIIENFKQPRDHQIARGPQLESATDTEVVVYLIFEHLEAGSSPEGSVKNVLPQLRGTFAFSFTFREHPDLLIGARRGSPRVIGYRDGETYFGSDALALAPLTQNIAYLDGGDWVVIRHGGAQIFEQTILVTQTLKSFIHAEGYASGEMKYGPVALIDEDVLIIVRAPSGPLFEKTVSNM